MTSLGMDIRLATSQMMMTQATTLDLVCWKVKGLQMANQRSIEILVKVNTETTTATFWLDKLKKNYLIIIFRGK